jgi:hypothetical protein
MKKRGIASAFCLFLITITFTSCFWGEKLTSSITTFSETKNSSSEATIITMPSEYTSLPEEATTATVAKQIARLLKEDGSGKISINSTLVDIKKTLQSNKIPFEASELGIMFTDGTVLMFNGDDGKGNRTFSEAVLVETPKGLKIGDSVAKMKKLYGDADIKVYITKYYEYKLKNELSYQFNVDGDGDAAKISDIFWGLPPERPGNAAKPE